MMRRSQVACQRGSLLIVTLWIVTILSVLAVAIGRYLGIEVKLAGFHRHQARAAVLARSGVFLAMQRLQEDAGDAGEGYDWLADDWAVFDQLPEDPTLWVVQLPEEGELGEGGPTIMIRIVDEERKLPINRATDSLDDPWYSALATLLASPARAQRIVDYLDPNEEPFNPEGIEGDDAAVPLYLAKNHPVVAHEELLDIPDLAEAFATLRDLTTVAEIAHLNLNTVRQEVLEALGFSGAMAQAIADCQRGGVAFQATDAGSVEAMCPAAGGMSDTERNLLNDFGVTSQVFTVTSHCHLGQPPIEARVEAIIERSLEADQVPAILAWREF